MKVYKIENLSFGYENERIIKELSFEVEKGEVVIVARGDKPYVAILPFSEYKRLREREKERGWEESLKRILAVGAAIKAAWKGKLLPPPENVIGEMRKERDEHLTRLR